MVNQLKVYAVEDLKAKLSEAKIIALIDYQGLTANQFNQLRQQLRQLGSQVQVVKNRLLMRALAALGIELDQPLRGQTAVVWQKSDEVDFLKAIKKMAAEWEKPSFKLGVYQKELLPPARLEALAKLPGLDQLRAQFLLTLMTPWHRWLADLKGPAQKFILILKARAKVIKE